MRDSGPLLTFPNSQPAQVLIKCSRGLRPTLWSRTEGRSFGSSKEYVESLHRPPQTQHGWVLDCSSACTQLSANFLQHRNSMQSAQSLLCYSTVCFVLECTVRVRRAYGCVVWCAYWCFAMRCVVCRAAAQATARTRLITPIRWYSFTSWITSLFLVSFTRAS